jgi:hypothetical protein
MTPVECTAIPVDGTVRTPTQDGSTTKSEILGIFCSKNPDINYPDNATHMIWMAKYILNIPSSKARLEERVPLRIIHIA